MLSPVLLKPLSHRNKEHIGIYFTHSKILSDTIRKIEAVKWSPAHKCWYLPCTHKHYDHLAQALAGKAHLNVDMLKQYLLGKRRGKGSGTKYKRAGFSASDKNKSSATADP